MIAFGFAVDDKVNKDRLPMVEMGDQTNCRPQALLTGDTRHRTMRTITYCDMHSSERGHGQLGTIARYAFGEADGATE